jgi:hypothetical protein
MSNLIIFVIAVLLVAVGVLMAIWYDGGVYDQGQVKSQALAILKASEQIAEAWQIYATDHGGDSSLPCSPTCFYSVFSSTFVPKYLDQMPNLADIASGGPSSFYPTYLTTSASTNVVANSNTITLSYISQAVCTQVNLITYNLPITPYTTDPVASNTDRYNHAPLGWCYVTSGGQYTFIRRVFQ